MKNNLLRSLLFSLVFLTACGQNWDYSDPNMPEAYREQHESVIEEQKAILKENPTELDALFELGFRYQMLGDYKEAVYYYEKVLDQTETHYPTFNNLADIYETMGDYEKAAEYIKKAYVLKETSTEAIKDTIRILLKADDPDNAQKALENFTEKVGSTDEAMQKLISELYQNIVDYRANQ